MPTEIHKIVLPFDYLSLNHLPLRNRISLEYDYNNFLSNYLWNFIQTYNYEFAKTKNIEFWLKTSSNYIFGGELLEEKNGFRTFKINNAFLNNTTDFNDWHKLVSTKNLVHLEHLAFDFVDKWLSIPSDDFFYYFQYLKEITINCHCTNGFGNLINISEIQHIFKNKLGATKININITEDFY